MKLKIIGSSVVLVAFIILSSHTLNPNEDKNEVLMRLLLQGLNYNHYQPQEINDGFSEEVFDLYLNRLDYGKRYLTQIDVEILDQYKHSIDEEAKKGTFDFFDISAEIYLKRVKEAEAYYQEILIEPFDFQKDEYLEGDVKNRPFARNKDELREVWRKLLKYQTMTRLVSMQERQEKSLSEGDPEITEQSFEELEAKARDKVRKIYEDAFIRLGKTKVSDLRAMYINAIANRFDPHTLYLPPRDKENFDIRMSGQYGGIGAELSDKDAKISVVRIIAGSPCYRQGELEVGDEIIKVAQGDGEAVDVVDMRIDDAIKLIRGKKGTEVRLTVKKIDGSTKVVPIVRDVVQLAATYAKSAIINREGSDEKVGYIHLPKFYVNFNDRNGRHCSEDIAKEIEKLKQEGVSGIILDLRNNGGGSLPDVIDMTGLFIEDGPVVQVKSRKGRPSVLEDEDRRLQYDGALVVLVNSFSASASEILAAAIQDYGRGIIIGTPTFGKGTVQQVINLDRFVRGAPELKPLGSMKLTTQKFYRINGGATQIKGVVPDIILPDNYVYLKSGERNQEYSMPWDEIAPVPYKRWTHDNTTYEEVIQKSKTRTEFDPTFQLIDERARKLKEQQEDEIYTLQLAAYQAEKKGKKQESKKYDSLKEAIIGFEASSLQADLAEINSTKEAAKSRENWLKSIRKDPYIFEAMKVAMDMN